jgi:hypothetical protein
MKISRVFKNPRILGFFVILGLMTIIALNNEIKVKHPVLSFLFFFGAIPSYLWILFQTRSKKNKNTIVPMRKQTENNEFENKISPVSHIEKKTTVTNTTVTTETIYFKKNCGKYLNNMED